MPTSPDLLQAALLPRKGRAKIIDAILKESAPDIQPGFPEMALIIDEDPPPRKKDPTRAEYQVFLGYHPEAYLDFQNTEGYKRAGHRGDHRIGILKSPTSLEEIVGVAQKHCNVAISLQRGVIWKREKQLPPPTSEPHLLIPKVITFDEIESYFEPDEKVSVVFAENGENRQRLLRLARKDGVKAIRTTIPFVLAIVYRGDSYRISTEGLGGIKRSFTDFPSIKEMRAHSLHPELIWEFI